MTDEVRFFSALSSEPRIKILRLLKEHPQCVNAMAQRLRMTQSAVSQHLRVLKDAGLVKARKTGYWVHYEADAGKLQSRGKSLAGLFGGWFEPASGKGTANCPPELLAECAPKRAARPASRSRKG